MNETKCSKCKHSLPISEFTYNDTIYKTCNICREQQNNKRRKHVCDVCGIKGVYT